MIHLSSGTRSAMAAAMLALALVLVTFASGPSGAQSPGPGSVGGSLPIASAGASPQGSGGSLETSQPCDPMDDPECPPPTPPPPVWDAPVRFVGGNTMRFTSDCGRPGVDAFHLEGVAEGEAAHLVLTLTTWDQADLKYHGWVEGQLVIYGSAWEVSGPVSLAYTPNDWIVTDGTGRLDLSGVGLGPC